MRKPRTEESIDAFEKRYREPISKLKMAVGQIENTHQDVTVSNYTQKMKSYGEQLLRASKMVADYSRLSNGLYRHHEACIDIVRYVRGIARAAAPFALQNCIGFSYHMPPDPIYMITEVAPLTAIIGHLLSNACRFTAPENKITVTLDQNKEQIFIFVWDRGTGIPKSVAPHIFEPYYTYAPDGVTFPGNGLGLTLAKEFAHFLGGDLAFAPNGKGTFFVLTLPLHRRKRPRRTRPPIPSQEVKMIMSDVGLKK